MTSPDELKEEAQAVSWWLSPENQGARKELRERNEALAQWLDKVEAMVQGRLAEIEAQEEVAAKV